MTTSWTLTRERICDKALEKCQRLGVGRAVSADDRALCLEALDGILKNLMWYGLSWPKTTSGATTLAIGAGTQTTSLPTDYYTGAMLKYVDASGQEQPLRVATTEEWDAIQLKSTQQPYPDRCYIDNFNVVWFYPVPSISLAVNLYYQKVIDDTVAGQAPDLDSPWLIGLPYGVAAEVGDEFGVKPDRLARFEAKWAVHRDRGIRNEAPPGPDRVQVSD